MLWHHPFLLLLHLLRRLKFHPTKHAPQWGKIKINKKPQNYLRIGGSNRDEDDENEHSRHAHTTHEGDTHTDEDDKNNKHMNAYDEKAQTHKPRTRTNMLTTHEC